MCAVQLNKVATRINTPACTIGKGIDDNLDFLYRHLTRRVKAIPLPSTRTPWLMPKKCIMTRGTTVIQLRPEENTFCMRGIHAAFPSIDVIIGVDCHRVCPTKPRCMDCSRGTNNGSNTAFCTGPVPPHNPVIKTAIGFCCRKGHRSHECAVLRPKITAPKVKRLPKRFMHANTLPHTYRLTERNNDKRSAAFVSKRMNFN